MSADGTYLGVRFSHVKEVFVKATMTCDKLDCCSVVLSVVDESQVEVLDRLGRVAILRIILVCFGPFLIQCSLSSCITLLLMYLLM